MTGILANGDILVGGHIHVLQPCKSCFVQVRCSQVELLFGYPLHVDLIAGRKFFLHRDSHESQRPTFTACIFMCHSVTTVNVIPQPFLAEGI